MERSPILLIELARPDAPEKSNLTSDQSWLLAGMSSYHDYQVFGFGVADLKKSPELGRIFSHLQPKEDGSFELELGVTLPDLLPKLEEKLDYAVEISVAGYRPRVMALSNQMVRINYKVKDASIHAVLPRSVLTSLSAANPLEIPVSAPVQLLRTTVTSRFRVSGSDAEDALEGGIQEAMAEFVADLNHLLSSVQMVLKSPYSHVSSAYDVNTFHSFYLIMRGREALKFGHGKISPHSGLVALNPPGCDDAQAQEFLSYLSGKKPIDDVRRTLAKAQTSMESGMLSFALLQMVIASEMAVARYLRERLIELGLSNKKWKDNKKNITYSQMLNIHLLAVTPEGKKPDQELVGMLNRARDCRNDFMHEGIFSLNREEIRELYRATERFVGYIEDLQSARIASAEQKL